SIPYTVTINNTGSPRTGLLTFTPSYAGGTFTTVLIQQNSSNCTYTLSPGTLTAPALGGVSLPFSIASTPAGCWWQPTTPLPAGVTATSGNVGCPANTFCAPSSGATVFFYMGVNTGAARNLIVTSNTLPASSASVTISQ